MTWFLTNRLTFDKNDDWNETEKYYKEYIYYDRYGIFDFIKDKSNLATYISDFYLSGTEIWLHFFIKRSYYFEDDFSKVSESEYLRKALEYIHLHMKRWNIVVRVNIDIEKGHIKNFDIDNNDEMIEFMLSEYQRQPNKEDFLEYWIFIRLSDDAWKHRVHI